MAKMQLITRTSHRMPKSNFNQLPTEVKGIVSQFLQRKEILFFGQTSTENLHATDSYWNRYLENPPSEAESYKKLFLNPPNRKLEFVAIDAIGKEFILKFRNGILSVQDGTVTIATSSAVDAEKYHWKQKNPALMQLDIQFNLSRINEHIRFRHPDFGSLYFTSLQFFSGFKPDFSIVQLLLADPDIDVNEGGEGWPPLVRAITNNCLSTFKLLLKRKDLLVNKGAYNNCTPLMAAVDHDKIEMIELLLNHPDIDVNLCTTELCTTALIKAVQKGNKSAVQKLLAHSNIDIRFKRRDGRDALAIAKENRDDQIIELLESYPHSTCNFFQNKL
jgi:ankyrin repeat protein